MKDISLIKMSELMQNLSKNFGGNSNFYVFDSSQVPALLQQQSPYRNDFYTLVFVVKGEMEITIDFNHHHLGSQQVAFISPKQVMEVDDKKVEFGIGIIFKKEFLLLPSDWLQKLPLFHKFHSTPGLNLSSVDQTLLSTYLSQMLHEYLSNHTYKFDIIKAHLILVLAHLSRIYSQSSMENEPKHNR